jgi:hypothetical protein
MAQIDTNFKTIHQVVIGNKSIFAFNVHHKKLNIIVFSGYQKV